MFYLVLFCLFILGLIIGSFLNVVILRWNTGWSISRGRSKCFSCGKTLSWYELIPLFSFLIQKRKCRGCESKISWQYPTVELATGILLPATFMMSGEYLSVFFLTAVAVCLYIVMFVYDMRHKIIPDFFSYSVALIALLIIALEWYFLGFIDLGKIIAGPILFLFFYFFWFVSR
jgi:prepilin signal peptidase PulO-like enzyme (type II secretory pathway)